MERETANLAIACWGVESICSTFRSDWVTRDKVQLTDRTPLTLLEEERHIVSRMVDTISKEVLHRKGDSMRTMSGMYRKMGN